MAALLELILFCLLLAMVVLMSWLFFKINRLSKRVGSLEELLSNSNNEDTKIRTPFADTLEIKESSDVDNGKKEENQIDVKEDNSFQPVKALNDKTKKNKVIEAIINRKREISEADLNGVESEMVAFFNKYQNEDYATIFDTTSYYRLVDLSEKPDSRVVVVGDIHCDYYSLAAVLMKLSVANYDYFENAIFVFLGDYLDRGAVLFESLLLLMDLKEILGERMIMLKGNHEEIEYDSENGIIKAHVRPSQSTECLNEYCSSNKAFLEMYAKFFMTLPVYVYLKASGKNELLVHASIPRDEYAGRFFIDKVNGQMVIDANGVLTDRLKLRNAILHDMIWGDPKEVDEKIQVEGRFEFGRKQFDRFAMRNAIDLMLRSHEEVQFGHKVFFENRLHTIFSTGGVGNSQTCYPSVEPAFALVKEGKLIVENIYIYEIDKRGTLGYVNLFSDESYNENQVESFALDEEFCCSQDKADVISKLLKEVKSGFMG